MVIGFGAASLLDDFSSLPALIACLIAIAAWVVAPATDAAQMDTVITNSTVNGFLQASFAVLVIVIVANAALIWFRAAKAGSLPTTEVPATESHVVAPADFFATAEEKKAEAEWKASHDRKATVGS